MLTPTLFKIFLSDLFLILNDIDLACYAGDKTFYKAHDNVNAVVKTWKMSAEKLSKWFKDNQMKGNTGKCHLILLLDIKYRRFKLNPNWKFIYQRQLL